MVTASSILRAFFFLVLSMVRPADSWVPSLHKFNPVKDYRPFIPLFHWSSFNALGNSVSASGFSNTAVRFVLLR